MNEEEIQEALKIIKEPITVNSIEYKYFDQENYEKILRVYENCRWFISNTEQFMQNFKNQQQELDQYKNNWEDLKEYLNNDINFWKEQEKEWIEQGFMKFGGEANTKIIYQGILNKMKELEENK